MASKSILLRKGSLGPVAQAELIKSLQAKRGVHSATVEDLTDWSYEQRHSVTTGWQRLYVRGTDLAVRKAYDLAESLKIVAEDQNANHDHAACIAYAHKNGVPASWAHRVETYLSM